MAKHQFTFGPYFGLSRNRGREIRRVRSLRVSQTARSNLLLGLEVVEEDRALLGLLTPILDDDARAVDDLAGVTLAVDLACSTRNPR